MHHPDSPCAGGGPAGARLRQLFDEGQLQAAGALFLEELENNILPHSAELAHWLDNALGAQRTEKLVMALSSEPCLRCQKGFEVCDECHGHGVLAAGALCAQCLGFGRVRCDVCNGTGQTEFETLPRELWPRIIQHRLDAAGPFVADLIYRALPPFDGEHAVKPLTGRILNIAKLLGVLDNALAAANAFSGKAEVDMVVLRTRASRWGGAGELRLRDGLAALAMSLRVGSQKLASDAPEIAAMLARADRLEELARTGAFAGTSFDQPALFAAV